MKIREIPAPALSLLFAIHRTRMISNRSGEPAAWEERFEIEPHRSYGTQAELHTFIEARVGHESHYLCLHCGRQTHRDPKHDSLRCTGCGKARLKNTCLLEDEPCPQCRQGIFHGKMTAIS